MRSRLARKVLKHPGRYSAGSRQAACRRLNCVLLPTALCHAEIWKDMWLELDRTVMKAARARLLEGLEDTVDTVLESLGIPADLLKGDGTYSGLTTTMEQWKERK